MSKIKKSNLLKLIVTISLSSIILTLCFAAIGAATKDKIQNIPIYIGFVFITEILFNLFLAFYDDDKKVKLRFIILAGLNLIPATLMFISIANNILAFFAFGIMFFIFTTSCILQAFEKKTKRHKVLYILAAIISSFIGTNVFFTAAMTEILPFISIIIILFYLLTVVWRLIVLIINKKALLVLIKIMNKTHTFEAILCLIALMIACSIIFSMVEPEIKTFGEGLWYSFAVITTIGFGDEVASTLVGRILTVILGIYGIVIVAIITSIIVNYYNEVSHNDKEEQEEIKEIEQKEDNNQSE